MTELDLHDWEVTDVAICRLGKRVTLTMFQPESKKTSTLILEGATRLHCSGMAMQNVILDSLIYNIAEERSCSDYCKKALRINDDFVDKNPSSKIFYLEPSVGMELTCCFTEFKFVQH